MAGLVGAGLAGLAAPAAACPQGARCIAMLSGPTDFTSIRTPETAAPARVVPTVTLMMRITVVPSDRYPSLRSSLSSFAPARISAGDVEMPWIWAVLASEVESRLPRYDGTDSFSMVLSPVVVTMPSESTPGVGLSGAF